MATVKTEKYIEAVGRRKSASARARLTKSDRTVVPATGKEAEKYSPVETMRVTALEPFLKVSLPTQFAVSVHVMGGGSAGQAVAGRHASSSALVDD